MKTKTIQPSEQELYYRRKNLKTKKRKEFWSDSKDFLIGTILAAGIITVLIGLTGGIGFVFGWSRYFASQTKQDRLERRIEQLEAVPHFFIRTNYFSLPSMQWNPPVTNL